MSDLPDLATFHTIDDFEEAARTRLSKMTYDYYRSGAGEEKSLARNKAAFDDYEVWYRVLVDVSTVDTSTTVLGTAVSLPVLIAPTAYHRLAHPAGEVETAKAAEAAGTIFCLSTLSNTSLEDVARLSVGPKWFQLYVHKDRGLTKSLIERAYAAGYGATVLTVDAPLLGRRIADDRNLFALPDGLVMANLGNSTVSTEAGSALSEVGQRHDASLNWNDLDWIRSISPLPLVLKGIVRADDARLAVERGVDAIVVSNHGARQLDGSPATIDALGPIAEVAAGSCEILLDGGVRWGSDTLKALAIGARAVLIGRPALWGLAVGGAAGVERVLELLRLDFSTTMALAGCSNVGAITSDLVKKRGG